MNTNFLNNLKLDRWWKIVLWLAIFLLTITFSLKPNFLDSRHITGLALGMVFVSIAFLIAEKSNLYIKPPNAYTGGTALITEYRIEHNIFTRSMFVVGILVIMLFSFLLIKSLI
jgi:hypothetical protein